MRMKEALKEGILKAVFNTHSGQAITMIANGENITIKSENYKVTISIYDEITELDQESIMIHFDIDDDEIELFCSFIYNLQDNAYEHLYNVETSV